MTDHSPKINAPRKPDENHVGEDEVHTVMDKSSDRSKPTDSIPTGVESFGTGKKRRTAFPRNQA